MPKRKSVKRVSKSRRRNSLRRKTLKRKTLRKNSKRVNKKRSSRKMRGGMFGQLPDPEHIKNLNRGDLIKLLKEKGFNESNPEYEEAFHQGKEALAKLYKDKVSTPLSPSDSGANSNCSSPLKTWENITVKQCHDGSMKVEFEPEPE
tara:strand:+ start:238 stop:678 length:441 start_codon:yes stop_codon:yes gene_type:complete